MTYDQWKLASPPSWDEPIEYYCEDCCTLGGEDDFEVTNDLGRFCPDTIVCNACGSDHCHEATEDDR